MIEGIVDDLRKLTLGREFDFTEFRNIVNVDEKKALAILNELFLFCYIKPMGKEKYKVVYGEERDGLIKERIEACRAKAAQWNSLIEHLEKL